MQKILGYKNFVFSPLILKNILIKVKKEALYPFNNVKITAF
jgi:hypothetical protein